MHWISCAGLFFVPDINLKVITYIEIPDNFPGEQIEQGVCFLGNGTNFKVVFVCSYNLE
jgi:hypothetical protein